jgi:hypothetical protein
MVSGSRTSLLHSIMHLLFCQLTFHTYMCKYMPRHYRLSVLKCKLSLMICSNIQYCTVLAVLVGLQTTPLNLSHSLLPTAPSVVQSLCHKQTVLSLTVLSIHPFRRPSWPLTISVGVRRYTVGSWLSLPLLLPTTDYCLRRLAHWLSGWLAQSYEIPVLRWACADGIVSTVSHGSFLHCDELVTGESSVVYSQCIAASG